MTEGKGLDEVHAQILRDVKEKGVKFIDLEFVDILGQAKMCEITPERLESSLCDGTWFDGSSIEGFTRIFESDMFLQPDPSTYATLPWADHKVARLICDVYTHDGEPFLGDPRQVLKKQLAKAKEAGFELKTGPELEFFIFKNGDKGNGGNGNGCGGNGCGGHGNGCCGNGSSPPSLPQTHDDAGYFDLATRDLAVDLRREIVPGLEAMGMHVEMSHHECAPGQHEIDFRYGDALSIADAVQTYKTTVKTVAKKYGVYASFMPKPLAGVNGSGMHVHQSLWKGSQNTFFDENDKYWLSDTARHYIAGQLSHARALSAVLAPTVNSYKRLVPGYEAPVYICWGRTNRSALIRIPRILKGKEKGMRAELRCPDPSANPYLAFTVMLAAGLDGVKHKRDPPHPVEENVYHFDDAKLKNLNIPQLPASLKEASDELAQDKVLQEALGAHVYEKLCDAQTVDWNGYRTSVSNWEIERYYGVL